MPHYDTRETRDPRSRELDLMGRLPGVIERALKAPGWRAHLGALEPATINARIQLATLPVLRKSDLPALQRAQPPFGGFSTGELGSYGRLFTSPGPIYEPESRADDPWRAARALYAAGFRAGDVVLNTFSYHLTPGGFILDSGARAVGCAVIPAGPGNTEQQLDLIERLRPVGYTGTPDFLKIVLDAAHAAGRDASSIRKALVSGAAFPPSLRAALAERGVTAYQCYATADLGVVAYETPGCEGMVVNEDLLVEIVRPGTNVPVADGEVGEVVVTSFDPHHPWVRLALGDLSAILPGHSPCGRTNTRIRGWLGRADQTAKVKGLFVRPEQIAAIAARHPELGRVRVQIERAGETDAMTLLAETATPSDALAQALAASVKAVTQLSAQIELAVPGNLPNDGKVIDDRRPVPG